MAKYIDSEALIDRLKKVSLTDGCFGLGVQTGINHAIECVQEAPATDAVSRETYEAVVKALQALAETDVVEVIRCGKCRHHLTRSGRCVKNEGIFSVSDFCSKGELK